MSNNIGRRTLNGENTAIFDSIDISTDLEIDGNLGIANQFVSKNENNVLSYNSIGSIHIDGALIGLTDIPLGDLPVAVLTERSTKFIPIIDTANNNVKKINLDILSQRYLQFVSVLKGLDGGSISLYNNLVPKNLEANNTPTHNLGLIDTATPANSRYFNDVISKTITLTNLQSISTNININGYLVPGSISDIGKTGSKFANIYSENFIGTLAGNANSADTSIALTGHFSSDIDSGTHNLVPSSTNILHNGNLGSSTNKFNKIFVGSVIADSITHSANMDMGGHNIHNIGGLTLSAGVLNLLGKPLQNFNSITFATGTTSMNIETMPIELETIKLYQRPTSPHTAISVEDNINIITGKILSATSVHTSNLRSDNIFSLAESTTDKINFNNPIAVDNLYEKTENSGINFNNSVSFSSGLHIDDISKISGNYINLNDPITVDNIHKLSAIADSKINFNDPVAIDNIHKLSAIANSKINFNDPITVDNIHKLSTVANTKINFNDPVAIDNIHKLSQEEGHYINIMDQMKTNNILPVDSSRSIGNSANPYLEMYSDHLYSINMSLALTSGSLITYGLLEYSHSKQYINNTQEGSTTANQLFREFDGELETTYMKLYQNGNEIQKTTKILTEKHHDLGVQDIYSGPRTDGTQYIAYRTACGVQAGGTQQDETYTQVNGRLDTGTADPIELLRIDNNLCKTSIMGGYGMPLIEINHHTKKITFKNTSSQNIIEIDFVSSKTIFKNTANQNIIEIDPQNSKTTLKDTAGKITTETDHTAKTTTFYNNESTQASLLTVKHDSTASSPFNYDHSKIPTDISGLNDGDVYLYFGYLKVYQTP